MARPPVILEADVDNLLLDPENPRLRQAPGAPRKGQPDLLKEMVAWELDELIVSYIESGFWKHEPIIVVPDGREKVVVEGNRRTAALKCLREVVRGNAIPSRRLTRLIAENLPPGTLNPDSDIFTAVPYVEYPDRRSVVAYLGFRHVTGVKQWEPQEKAAFIAHLIDKQGYDYGEAAKLIGSYGEYVRRNYVAFHLLNEFEEVVDNDDAVQALEKARDDFSVFFLSLREEGVRRFLNVSLDTPPREVPDVIRNLDRSRVDQFLVWMFGSDAKDSLIGESRNIKKFAEILNTPDALAYISERPSPSLEVAYGMTKGAADDVVAALRSARESLRIVLADIDLSDEQNAIPDAAWPVISAAAEIARRIGGDTMERLRASVCHARLP